MLARAARERLKAVKADGQEPLPAGRLLDAGRVASLADLSCKREPGPLPDDCIIVVSGLPRSGTSMMMQMLEAGGCPVLTDSKRVADESNPRGYYEYDGVRRIGRDGGWLQPARGKAIKIIAQLLPHLRQDEHYRVVFMERPLSSVMDSQDEMLQRLARKGSPRSGHRLAETYLKQVDAVRRVLEDFRDTVQVLVVDYDEAVADPANTASRVNRFLGALLDESAMASVVEAGLRLHFTPVPSDHG